MALAPVRPRVRSARARSQRSNRAPRVDLPTTAVPVGSAVCGRHAVPVIRPWHVAPGWPHERPFKGCSNAAGIGPNWTTHAAPGASRRPRDHCRMQLHPDATQKRGTPDPVRAAPSLGGRHASGGDTSAIGIASTSLINLASDRAEAPDYQLHVGDATVALGMVRFGTRQRRERTVTDWIFTIRSER